MLQIQDTIVSFDVLERRFLCDLAKCKGECCIEGDCGAPLEDDEIPVLERLVDVVWDQLSDASKEVIKKQGVWYTDPQGDKVTSIVNGRECVFTTIDKDGMCKCALEIAYREGLGAGSIIYLRKIFEMVTDGIADAESINVCTDKGKKTG